MEIWSSCRQPKRPGLLANKGSPRRNRLFVRPHFVAVLEVQLVYNSCTVR